jgi:hypothetical protein
VIYAVPDGALHGVRLLGANLRLADWAPRSQLLDAVLGPSGRAAWAKELVKALSRDHDRAIPIVTKLVDEIWRAVPGLGPFPLAGTSLLTKFEFDRVFYAGYRDHAGHQLRVFLLGLYLLEEIDSLRRDLIEEIGDTEKESSLEAMRRWIVTSLFHDVGYVLECEPDQPGHEAQWKSLVDATSSHTDNLLRPFLTAAAEKKLANELRLYKPVMPTPAYLADQDGYFDILDKEALACGLSDSPRGLKAYLSATRQLRIAEGRPTFFDHGIASALLLIHFWHGYQARLAEVHEGIGDRDRLRTKLPPVAIADACRETVHRSAAAIALHNINKGWEKTASESLHDYGLTLDQFWLARRRESGQIVAPLAFLLGVVDTLQDWDRPRFRPPDESDARRLTSEDMSVRANDGKIGLYFPEDDEHLKSPGGAPYGRFSGAKRALKSYLDNADIESLVTWDSYPQSDLSCNPGGALRTVSCQLVDDLQRAPVSRSSIPPADVSDLFVVPISSYEPGATRDAIVAYFDARPDATSTLVALYDTIGYYDLLLMFRHGGETYETVEALLAVLTSDECKIKDDVHPIDVRIELGSLGQLSEATIKATDRVERRRLGATADYERFRCQRAFIYIRPRAGEMRKAKRVLSTLAGRPGTEIVEAISVGDDVVILELFMRCSETSQINTLNRTLEAAFRGQVMEKYSLVVYDYLEPDHALSSRAVVS